MKTVIVASVLALTCGAAQAATCTQAGNNANQSVTFTLTQSSPGAVQAVQCYSGNDTPTIDDSFSLGGVSGWMLADKTDDDSDYLAGGFSEFTYAPDFTWSVLNPLGYESIMVTLKQGPSFAAFLLDSAAALSGTWSTMGPGNSTNALSHASVYFGGDMVAPAPIPLPAGAALLPVGLAAFAFLRRRKAR